MDLRKKFLCLTMLAGLILMIVSGVGYYVADKHLSESVENDMKSIVGFQADAIDNWLLIKGQNVVTIGATLENLPPDIVMMKSMTSCMNIDPEIFEFVNGNEDGKYIKWGKSAVPDGWDPRTRGWYKEAKAKGGLVFTDAYPDSFTGKMVVTASYPYKDERGNFRGALCYDISLETLSKRVEGIKINGEGQGFVLDKSGNVVANAQAERVGKNVADDPVFKDYAQKMMSQEHGKISYEKNGKQMVMVFAKAKTTNWIVGLEVPADILYASLWSLKVSYIALTIIGFLILAMACLLFARKISAPLLSLTTAAEALAAGDLRAESLPVTTQDEIGKLTGAFNVMSTNLRDLIRRVSSSSDQIAAASEQLTASAAQSADAATHVAQTIVGVAQGADSQMQAIEHGTARVANMVKEVQATAEKTNMVSEISCKTTAEAQKGSTIMNNAIMQMTNIEKTVNESAITVSRLGDNSKQIGQIVETISGIAGQTNLLALNAAIEAARAGEQGRGFAVVAEEVRKLAEQSRLATEEIAKLIQNIQQDTMQAVEAMQVGTQDVKSGSEAIHTVGAAFQDIIETVDEITSHMQGIANSVSALSAESDVVVESIQQAKDISNKTAAQTQTISAATQEQSASMEEIASSSQTLSQMAQEMQNMVNKFKI